METSRNQFWGVVAVLLLLCVSAAGPSIYAQQASANVNGVVSDQSGAAVADAQVQITNVGTAVVRSTKTNGSGTYVFLNVTPGAYTIQVGREGFQSVTQSQVALQVNQTATFDFHLPVGQATQTVTVDAIGSQVEASTAELGTVIATKEMNNLPLNGRNFTQLLLLTPGVAPVTLDQTGSGGGGFVGNALGAFSFPAVNGARVRSNTFLLDGVNNLNTFLSSYNYAPIVDAIAEFKVQTHNDDTRYGGVVGGIVNVVSKSGTNDYHGTLWDFLRNEKMDANGFFPNRFNLKRNPLRRNQFGAAIGGPISIPKLYNGKDKTFFYAAYEGYRDRETNQGGAKAPSAIMRQGDFGALCSEGFVAGVCTKRDHQLYDITSTVPDPAKPGSFVRPPFLNNVIPQSKLSPAALLYQTIFPVGKPDPSNPGFNIAFPNPGSIRVNQDQGQIRVDQYFGNKDQVMGRFSKYYQLVDQPQNVIQRHLAPIYGYNATAHETHTFGPTAILDLYFGRNYGNNEQTLTFANEKPFTESLKQGGYSTQFLTLGSLVTAPAMGPSGYEGTGFQQFQGTSLADVWETGGNFTKIFGRHIFNIGGSMQTNGFHSPIKGSHESFSANQTAGLGANQGLGGDSYASFLLGAPENSGIRITNETVHGGWSNAVYLHDQWKATKNLTVNAGLRYDLKLWPIYGSGNDLYTGEPNPVTGQYILTALPPDCSATRGAPCIPSGVFTNNGGKPTPYSGLPPHVIVTPNKNHAIINNDYGNWAGRVGLAYRVNDKMAVRAGYGRFFDTWGAAAQDAQNFNGNWPAVGLELNGLNPITVTDPITDPLHLGSGGGIIYPSPDPYHAGTWSVDPNYKTPYSDQYNFGFQQELPSSMVLDVNYVGSVSHKLDVTDVLNVAPTPGPGDPVARQPFPYMGNPWFQQSIGNSNFSGLEVSLNKRATHNVAFLVSYTWSKSIDDGCSGDIGAGCSIQNVYDRNGDRSVSSFNLPQVFSASFTATSPYGKGRQLQNRLVTAVIGGWALNGIATLHSGTPYDIQASNKIPNICNCANTERASIVGNPIKSGPKNADTTWLNTAAIVSPDPFTFGNLGRNTFLSDRWRNMDLSVFRQFQVGLGEARVFEFRAEAFNVFNNVVFGTPHTSISDSQLAKVTFQANGARQLQVALKFYF